LRNRTGFYQELLWSAFQVEMHMTFATSRAALAAILTLSLLSVGACTRTERYTATGAVLGAGGGAIIGAAADGHAGTGAVIGGIGGAAAGWCIAKRCLY
jgi:hypothetical protein